MFNNWNALTRLFSLKDSLLHSRNPFISPLHTFSPSQSCELVGRWRPSPRSLSGPASMVWVPGCGLRSPGQYNVSSPGPGQSHSDLGHSDTPETYEETPGTRGLRQTFSDQWEHHGAQCGDHGGAGDHHLGIHSHGPGGGASGRSSGRGLPRQLHCPGQLPVQLVWTRVQPGVPARSVQTHSFGCDWGGEKKWSNYGFTIRSERDRVTHVAT